MVIGANPGNSALLDMTPRSSPKVLIAQTPNPLSAANEQYAPPFRQSFGEVQARLFRKTAPGQHHTCHTPLLRAIHTGAFQKRPLEHSPINHQRQPTTSQPLANYQPDTNQLPTSSEPSPMATSALIGPVQVRAITVGGYLSLNRH